jgi:hypothetical protein
MCSMDSPGAPRNQLSAMEESVPVSTSDGIVDAVDGWRRVGGVCTCCVFEAVGVAQVTSERDREGKQGPLGLGL